MTAPIVWHALRDPMTETAIALSGAIMKSTKTRMRTTMPTDTPGQLWQRLAARDVQLHGQPVPVIRTERFEWGGSTYGYRSPREFIALSLIEARREKTPS